MSKRILYSSDEEDLQPVFKKPELERQTNDLDQMLNEARDQLAANEEKRKIKQLEEDLTTQSSESTDDEIKQLYDPLYQAKDVLYNQCELVLETYGENLKTALDVLKNNVEIKNFEAILTSIDEVNFYCGQFNEKLTAALVSSFQEFS